MGPNLGRKWEWKKEKMSPITWNMVENSTLPPPNIVALDFLSLSGFPEIGSMSQTQTLGLWDHHCTIKSRLIPAIYNEDFNQKKSFLFKIQIPILETKFRKFLAKRVSVRNFPAGQSTTSNSLQPAPSYRVRNHEYRRIVTTSWCHQSFPGATAWCSSHTSQLNRCCCWVLSASGTRTPLYRTLPWRSLLAALLLG